MIYYGLEWKSLDSYFQMKELSAAPATPPANELRLYVKDKAGASALYLKDDAGNEREIGPANISTGTGANGRVAFWTGTSTLSSSVNLFWDNANSRLGIGTITPDGVLTVVEQDNKIFNLYEYNNTDGAVLRGSRARGTIASPSAVTTDDTLTGLRSFGYTSAGAFGSLSAAIDLNAAESFTSTAQGTYLRFRTTATGTTGSAERFRVGPAGQLGIGGATFGSSGQVLTSGGASAAPTWSAVTVADDAITFAKLQNIATQRVIGRNTASTGDPEEVTAPQVLDWIGSTRGSVLYRGASGWAALTPGTSGFFLKSQGSGQDPVYDAIGLTPVNIQLFNTSSSWTRPTGSYSLIIIQLWAGGGAGGGGAANAPGGGGGGGCYAERLLPFSSAASSETVTVGAGGTGGSADGPAGGNTSFGSHLTAFGGGGGAADANGGGGGGGGGMFAAGSNATTTAGAAGGGVAAGAGSVAGANGGDAGIPFTGGGGGGAGLSGDLGGRGGDSVMGGGGGGAGTDTVGTGTNRGGRSMWGGGGGGGAANSATVGPLGQSIFAQGDGGDGTTGAVAGSPGTIPSGGGGGSEGGNGGNGANGQVIIITM